MPDFYSTRVRDVMTKEVVTVAPQDSVHEALQLLTENRVSVLVVTDSHNRCVGILSTSDIVEMTQELDEDIAELADADQASHRWLVEELTHGAGEQAVNEVMTREVASVQPDALLLDAAREMHRRHIHRLPVVDDEQVLKGIISTMDVLKAVVESSPGE